MFEATNIAFTVKRCPTAPRRPPLTYFYIIIYKIFFPDILSRTECCQLLLLCTACLVNLVRELELEKKEDDKNDSDIIEVLNKHKTVERLLDAVKRRGPNISVFLQVSVLFS